jgi:hypothetical protein
MSIEAVGGSSRAASIDAIIFRPAATHSDLLILEQRHGWNSERTRELFKLALPE